jgi:glycosyltransferase involved in cell wall biosynthesis
MGLKGRRVLFISYNGMLSPLGQSQVLPYLRELSKRGLRFTLLSFETAGAFDPAGSEICRSLRRQLAAENIEWHWLRYHRRPSLPATMYDVMKGVRLAKSLVRRNGIELVHARSHIPATIALALKKRFGLKMIFDVRGLMAEEYVDAEHWREGSIRYRLTKAMERRALAASEGVVTLTEKIWPIIKEWEGLRGREVLHEVVPCCADLELFRFSEKERIRRRMELGLQDRFVVVHSGSIGGWYFTDKEADFFAELSKRRSDAHFLWLTRGSAELIRNLMRERGIAASSYTIRAGASSEIASYLSAGDAGIAFYKPGLSRFATSPVKVTEYLACGLPVIINLGVGDSDALIRGENVGALVNDESAAVVIEEYVREREATRARTRTVAEKLFDVSKVGVERYLRLYQRVLNGQPQAGSSPAI